MTHLQGTELDTILVTIKQEENIMNAIESFHTAFIFNSLPVFEITAAFLGDVYVPVEETDSAAVRGHVLKRLTGLISDAAEIAALKAEVSLSVCLSVCLRVCGVTKSEEFFTPQCRQIATVCFPCVSVHRCTLALCCSHMMCMSLMWKASASNNTALLLLRTLPLFTLYHTVFSCYNYLFSLSLKKLYAHAPTSSTLLALMTLLHMLCCAVM